jgi:hypothetical protein
MIRILPSTVCKGRPREIEVSSGNNSETDNPTFLKTRLSSSKRVFGNIDAGLTNRVPTLGATSSFGVYSTQNCCVW